MNCNIGKGRKTYTNDKSNKRYFDRNPITSAIFSLMQTRSIRGGTAYCRKTERPPEERMKMEKNGRWEHLLSSYSYSVLLENHLFVNSLFINSLCNNNIQLHLKLFLKVTQGGVLNCCAELNCVKWNSAHHSKAEVIWGDEGNFV